MRSRLAVAAAAVAATLASASAVPRVPLGGAAVDVAAAVPAAGAAPLVSPREGAWLARTATAVGWRQAGDVFEPYEEFQTTCAPSAAAVEILSRPATCPCYVYYALQVQQGGGSTTRVDALMMRESAYRSWSAGGYAGTPDYLPEFSRRGATFNAAVSDTFLNATGDYRLVVVRAAPSPSPATQACLSAGEIIFEAIPTPCPVRTTDGARTSGAAGAAKEWSKTDRGHRIVGGRDVTSATEQALMVALFHDRSSSPFCGGSLLVDGDRLAVLTAAHCVATDAPPAFVSVGGHTPTTGTTFRVRTVVTHPSFDSVTLRNDIALLFLDATGAEAGALRGTGARLNTAAAGMPTAGSAVSVIGFGALREYFFAAPSTHTLRKVDLPVFTTDQCNTAYNHPNAVNGQTQLCAGGMQGCDSCQGTWRVWDGGRLCVGVAVVVAVAAAWAALFDAAALGLHRRPGCPHGGQRGGGGGGGGPPDRGCAHQMS